MRKSKDTASHLPQPACLIYNTARLSLMRFSVLNPRPLPLLLMLWTSEELKAHMQAVLDGRAEGRREALAVESREGLRLLTEFRATSASQVVLYVERVRNELQRLHYGSTLRAMETRGDGVGANQHWLWHGTKYATVLLVVKNGFNRSYSTTAAYGKGVYFARDAAYSVGGYCPPDNRRGAVHSIILARVLVGRATLGRGGMVAPPPIEGNGGGNGAADADAGAAAVSR